MKQLVYKDLPVYSFESDGDFYDWLAMHHESQQPFWLRIYKKASGTPTVIYTDAVDVVLCWGWIDGLLNKYDDVSYVIRITPRRPKSVWSKVNVDKVQRLIETGKMQKSGLEKVEAAKADGRWDAAYAGSGTIELTDNFKNMLQKNKKAQDFYESLNRTEKYPFLYRLATVVGDERRVSLEQKLLQKLERQEKF